MAPAPKKRTWSLDSPTGLKIKEVLEQLPEGEWLTREKIMYTIDRSKSTVGSMLLLLEKAGKVKSQVKADAESRPNSFGHHRTTLEWRWVL